MFQSVMDPKERRNLGAHYTSEKNILKLIKPLFLDELWAEFESSKTNKAKLNAFHERLSKLKFLDPACGCGNFLVITYRELRLLELAVLERLYGNDRVVVELADVALLDVDMMAGIEYEEFPARIAEVAMWLMDHQMNLKMSMEFGQYFARLPLIKSAKIVHANALQTDWENVVFKSDLSFILGNPPFIGKQMQNLAQKEDMNFVFERNKVSNLLDYVSAWYYKAAQLIQGTKTKAAFVSTNSITQGEQVGALWNLLFEKFKIKIHFAHRTFSWSNEAKGNAAVHCVIVGFANFDTNEKRIFEYENIKGEAHEIKVKNISPYLIEGKDFALNSRTKPISPVQELNFGNMANDGGSLILQTVEEYKDYISKEPNGEKFIKPFVGSVELINNIKRYCFWLVNVAPNELKSLPVLMTRIDEVRKFRSESTRAATNKLAEFPTLFGEIRQKKGNILVIPRVSSENRKYIPLAFYDYTTIINDRCTFMNEATLYHFGIMTSIMHMTWLKNVCGRLKSDYNYSNNIVYNNFPWPENPSDKQKETIETAAQNVLDARLEFPNSSLADLYNPLTMPPVLVKAHNDLDKAVDLAYRPQAFTSEANRMVFLFELYEKYTANLFTKEKVKKK